MNDLSNYRKSYEKSELLETNIPEDPINLFNRWFHEVEDFGGNGEVNAMTISTIGLDGFPKSRVVLLKKFSEEGFIFYTNYDSEKGKAVILARRLQNIGFKLIATYGTATRLKEVGLDCETVFKVNEGRPNIADYIKRGEIALVINTPLGATSHYDEQAIRKAALQFNVPTVTTMTGAEALIEAILFKLNEAKVSVRSLQEIHENGKSLIVNG